LAEIQAQINDRLQFRQSQLDDTIKRLEARVAALEVGTPLPADQTIELVVEHCTEAEVGPEPVHQPQPDLGTELDISRGMTAGERKG
jgi:hypothetical protein